METGIKFKLIVSSLLSLLVYSNAQMPEHWKKLSKEELELRLDYKPNIGKAKNIIFCLGDGMGQSTITAMRIYKGEVEGRPGDMTNLYFENFPDVGMVKAYTTTETIADSSGTATAYMTGARTKTYMVNVDDSNKYADCKNYDEKTNLKPITKLAKEAGKSVGMVTTSRLTHATPATAYAHTVNRWWESDYKLSNYEDYDKCPDVARQFVERGDHIDVMMGGGRREVLPTNLTDPERTDKTGRRLDGRNLITEWVTRRQAQGQNCSYVFDQNGFDRIDPDRTDSALGLFNYYHMNYEYERLNDTLGEPSLTEMTEKAIKILSKNKNGFFLFLEGARIDHGHHGGRAKVAITEGLEFERAIQKAVEMTNPEETLVIVTGDHSHAMQIVGYSKRGRPLFGLSNTKGDDGLPYTTILYSIGPGYNHSYPAGRQNLTNVDTESFEYHQQTAVPNARVNHAGEDLSVYAQGPHSHLIRRLTEQTYIHEVMIYAACLGEHNNARHCHQQQKNDNNASSMATSSLVTILLAVLAFMKLIKSNSW